MNFILLALLLAFATATNFSRRSSYSSSDDAATFECAMCTMLMSEYESAIENLTLSEVTWAIYDVCTLFTSQRARQICTNHAVDLGEMVLAEISNYNVTTVCRDRLQLCTIENCRDFQCTSDDLDYLRYL